MIRKSFASLRADIERELKSLDRLVTEAQELLSGIQSPPSSRDIRAAGSILHDFYTGAEKIFQRIAVEVDGGLPTGHDWHAQLLLRMSAPVGEVRPPVVSEELGEALSEYLRFRHLFRHVYGFRLRWDRCQELLADLPDIHARLRRELENFKTFLRSLETTGGVP